MKPRHVSPWRTIGFSVTFSGSSKFKKSRCRTWLYAASVAAVNARQANATGMAEREPGERMPTGLLARAGGLNNRCIALPSWKSISTCTKPPFHPGCKPRTRHLGIPRGRFRHLRFQIRRVQNGRHAHLQNPTSCRQRKAQQRYPAKPARSSRKSRSSSIQQRGLLHEPHHGNTALDLQFGH